MYFRPGNNDDYSNIVSRESFSGNGWHMQRKIENTNDGHIFLENRGSEIFLRSRNDIDISIDDNNENIKINQAPITWYGNRTQWKLTKAN